jgi:hypothetical protein
MSTTTDIIAAQEPVQFSFLTRVGQILESFRAAQEVAATYQQTRGLYGSEREIFDRAFDRI